MAVILRNGMSRTTTSTSEVPLRSSTIHVSKNGLISKITGTNDSDIIKTINLGYRGDHNVTRIYVKL